MADPKDQRWRYSALPTREASRWPGGQRLALWIGLGVEHYRLEGGITEDIIPDVPPPDLVNAAWRDYGNRVGAFRLLEALRRHQLPTSLLLNTDLYDKAPQLLAAAREAGAEFIAHGRSNSDTLAGLDAADEQSYLQTVFKRIAQMEGEAPGGWSSPWLAQTANTLDHLSQTGFRYLLDWRLDDQPVWLETRCGPLLAIPYAAELNDSTTLIGRHGQSHDFAQMIIDEIDQLLAEDREQAVVTSLVLHSFISGQPFRTRALQRAFDHIQSKRHEIWLTTPKAIHKAVLENPKRATPQPTA